MQDLNPLKTLLHFSNKNFSLFSCVQKNATPCIPLSKDICTIITSKITPLQTPCSPWIQQLQVVCMSHTQLWTTTRITNWIGNPNTVSVGNIIKVWYTVYNVLQWWYQEAKPNAELLIKPCAPIYWTLLWIHRKCYSWPVIYQEKNAIIYYHNLILLGFWLLVRQSEELTLGFGIPFYG